MFGKNLIAGAIAASVALLVPQVSAQTFSPTGPFTLANVSGPIIVSKAVPLSCSLTGGGSVDASGNATVTSILCGASYFSGFPYTVSSTAPGTITINGVIVSGVFGGECAGNLTGAYDASTGIITFKGATLPPTTGGNPCKLYGSVRISPALTF